MRKFFKGLGGNGNRKLSRRGHILDELYGPKLRHRRKHPVQPPENADEDLKQFYHETEWLQPVLNRFVGFERFRFHELDTPYVSLGTYYGPENGRTFEISFGSKMVGKVAIVPNFFRVEDEKDWASLRVRLTYPIELLNGNTVHAFLSSLIKLTQEFETNNFEAIQDDPRASTRASQAIVEAMWDCMNNPEDSAVIELSVSGPWVRFKDITSHYKKHGIDPWEAWEKNSDDGDL